MPVCAMRNGGDNSGSGQAIMDPMRMEDYIAAPELGALCMDDDAFIDINISDFDPQLLGQGVVHSPRVRSPLPSPTLSKRARGGGGRKRRASSIASDDYDTVQLRRPPALRKVEAHRDVPAKSPPSKPKTLGEIGSSKSFLDIRKQLVSELSSPSQCPSGYL